MERMADREIKKELILESKKALETTRKTPREVLEELAQTELFAFHGSGIAGIEELEPRQAGHYNYEKEGYQNDGPPAVCSVKDPEVAIFKGLTAALRPHIKIMTLSIQATGEKKHFFLTPEVNAKIAENEGLSAAVYVLDRGPLKTFRGELRSEQSVKPLLEVIVTKDDFPKDNVTVIPKEGFEKATHEKREEMQGP